jgi:hypothetical protein
MQISRRQRHFRHHAGRRESFAPDARMAQVKSHENPLLERGDIFFLYRPRVGKDEAHGLEDVERLFLLLKPWHARKYRLLIVGRKKLPDPSEHDRLWAFVWRVFTDRKELEAELGAEEYTTKTRGVRRVAAARPAGEGIYAIVRHGEHTHLAYVLEQPKRQGPAERELNIKREASYIIAVKNPESGNPPAAGLGPEREARFPRKLQEKFAGRRFIPVDPPDFLDYEGAELMLIGAAENAEAELGIKFRPDDEDEHTADVFRELQLPREVAREPLFEGEWK